MNLGDIAPGLHAIWDENPSAETREHLVQKIDAFHHRTFPSEFKRFTLLLDVGGQRRFSEGRGLRSDLL